jgi:hypothetical protein
MTVTANMTIDIPPIQILLFIFLLPFNFPLLTIFVGHLKRLCPCPAVFPNAVAPTALMSTAAISAKDLRATALI